MPTALYTFPDGETRPLDTPPYVDDAKVNLTDNARTIFMKRYARKTLDGSLQETPAGVFYRVAYHVAQGEPDETKRAAMTEQFYHLLASRRFFPNSPTFTGAGTRLGQLAACFVLGLEDDMGKDPQGIFSTLRVAALIQQTGGGNGFSFGKLRPKRDQVASTGGAATGPVGFLKMYDACFGEVEQGGMRRGANMAVLPVHHPDIREFITCKTEEGKIANFNISVGVTDAFMEAVTRGENFALVNPRNGEVWDTVDARALFDEIVKQAHHNGEPGLLFLDAANRANPVPHLYELEATNPCVTADTLVLTPDGERRVAEIYPGETICTVDGRGTVDRIEIHYDRPVFQVTFANEKTLRCTAAHQFWVPTKSRTAYLPVKLEQLKVGDEVRSADEWMPGSQSHLPTTQITAIEFAGRATVYDLHEPKTDTWITNGVVSRGCGEQWLGPYENCCLGSINLAEHWKTVAGLPVVDWEKLADSTRMATFFLDDVVTINAYVPVVPELREAAEASRRIGLGIMGLADLLYALHLPYDSEGGRALAGQVMEFVRYYALSTSVDLALERGPFKGYAGSVYDFNQPGGMPWQPPHPTQPTDYAFGRPTLYWDSLRRNVEDFGVRNACQTTIAPTGTLSSVAGCEGYGCEPVFALGYIRHFKDGQKDVELPYVSTAFQNALGHLNLGLDTERVILDHVARTGTCQDLPILPEAFRRTFVVSGDIAPRDHVLMQAALQQWVDNSISKTCNFPATATPEDVAAVYKLAWELGCKGITVYVTGSRDKVVLETKETQATKTPKTDFLAEALSTLTNAATVVEAAYLERVRPPALQGVTIRKDTPLGKAYITVNEDEQQEPFEVFINVGKAGSATTAISEGFGRLISLFLRSPSPMVPRARLAQVVEELAGIGGNRPWGFGNGRVLSLPDGIAKVLAQYLSGDNGHAATKAEAPDVPPQPFGFVVGDLCPDCGDATFVQVEGCRKCLACGYSEC